MRMFHCKLVLRTEGTREEGEGPRRRVEREGVYVERFECPASPKGTRMVFSPKTVRRSARTFTEPVESSNAKSSEKRDIRRRSESGRGQGLERSVAKEDRSGSWKVGIETEELKLQENILIENRKFEEITRGGRRRIRGYSYCSLWRDQ